MANSLRPALTHVVHRLLQRATGRDILRYDSGNFCELRRSRLIRTTGITCVVDVGANIGQYGRELREAGYSGRLVSFEPLSTPFQVLARRAAKGMKRRGKARARIATEAEIKTKTKTKTKIRPPRKRIASRRNLPSCGSISTTSISVSWPCPSLHETTAE